MFHLLWRWNRVFNYIWTSLYLATLAGLWDQRPAFLCPGASTGIARVLHAYPVHGCWGSGLMLAPQELSPWNQFSILYIPFWDNISVTVKWQRNSIRIREGPRNDASKKERTWRHAKWCPQIRLSDAVDMQLLHYGLTREKDEFGERIVMLTTSPGAQVFKRHFLIREVIHSFCLSPDPV